MGAMSPSPPTPLWEALCLAPSLCQLYTKAPWSKQLQEIVPIFHLPHGVNGKDARC